jgi:hypothetical protein
VGNVGKDLLDEIPKRQNENAESSGHETIKGSIALDFCLLYPNEPSIGGLLV